MATRRRLTLAGVVVLVALGVVFSPRPERTPSPTEVAYQACGACGLDDAEVDRLIDDFLARVCQKLDALKLHFNTALRNRQETLSGASNPRSRLQAQARWKDSMEQMADEAKSLRRTLSYLLRGLKSKSNFKPEIEANAHNSGFQKEIKFIQEQILKAEQRIKDYFLLPTHTINLEDLQGPNMLIYLYRVEKLSKELSASLRY